jgi:hypothetical protein
MKKAAPYFILALIAALLIWKSTHITREKSGITDLEQVLLPIRSSISLHSNLSYISNDTSIKMYYRTEFVMAPIIIDSSKRNDTVLKVENLEIDNVADSGNLKHYKILQAFSTKKLKAYLLVKEK